MPHFVLPEGRTLPNAMSHDSESIRAFILQSPPGQLQEVLKSLHTLCGGSDAFFASIADVCLEYHMRHLCAYSLTAGETGEEASKMVMCCKHNHLVSRIKRLSRSNGGVDGDTIAQPFLDYFGTAQGCNLVEGDDQAKFDRIDCVFFDYPLQVYFEIDPIEGKVVRCKPFAPERDASKEMQLLQCPGAFHKSVVHSIAEYVRQCFGADVWWQQSRHRMFAGQEEMKTAQKKQRTSRNVAASHVSVESDTTFMIAISCERYAPSSRWAARWKSLYEVHVGDGEASINGEGRVDGHYFEDSNIHVNVEDVMPEVHVPACSDVGAFAQSICNAIRLAESALQQKLEKHGKEVSETALKGLRRRLPVTKQPFDFQKAMLQLPNSDEHL